MVLITCHRGSSRSVSNRRRDVLGSNSDPTPRHILGREKWCASGQLNRGNVLAHKQVQLIIMLC